jgi:hypothetical protein
MSDSQDRLRILVDYWIEHSREHEHEMREWAELAPSRGEAVAQALLEAAARFAEASSCLERARKALKVEPT